MPFGNFGWLQAIWKSVVWVYPGLNGQKLQPGLGIGDMKWHPVRVVKFLDALHEAVELVDVRFSLGLRLEISYLPEEHINLHEMMAETQS